MNASLLSQTIPRAEHAPAPRISTSGTRRLVLIAAGIIVLLAAALAMRHWWTIGRFIETTDDAFVGADTTTISSKAAGFVTQIAVADNQPVRTGDLLATIDDRDFRAELARAEATVAGQQAALANLDAAADLQTAVIDEARAKMQATAAEKKRAAADVQRARDLRQRSVVSQQDFEQMDATAAQAEASDRAALAARVAAERQLKVIATAKQQAQAALAQAQASQELARLNLSYTQIRSPIDGVVGNRHARVGDYATIGAQLMSIVPSAGLYVDANFKESQIAKMHAGQRATIEADAWPGRTFRGHVESLSPATGAQFSLLPAENATGNFTKIVQRLPIRIMLDDAQLGALRPGLSVTARVDQR